MLSQDNELISLKQFLWIFPFSLLQYLTKFWYNLLQYLMTSYNGWNHLCFYSSNQCYILFLFLFLYMKIYIILQFKWALCKVLLWDCWPANFLSSRGSCRINLMVYLLKLPIPGFCLVISPQTKLFIFSQIIDESNTW